MSLECISGYNLEKLIASGYLEKKEFKAVVSSPTLSLEKIRSVFGVYPNTDGNNIHGIQLIRDIIFRVSKMPLITNGLCITAPHTHWEKSNPVILRFKNNHYLIGPFKPVRHSHYYPISFIFSNNVPLPYEWADESVGINERDSAVAYEAIEAVNKYVYRENWPLGIALNNRFKELFSEKRLKSYEIPFEEQAMYIPNAAVVQSENQIEPSDLAIIVPSIIDSPSNSSDNNPLGQIAWHSCSDYYSSLSHDEIVLMRSMRDRLENLGDEKTKQQIIKRLIKGFVVA